MRALSLFSGCGGLDLGAEYAGIEIAAQCEIDKDCRVILRKHWPETIIYEDVRTLDADKLFRDIGPIDIVFGGPPCQPVSVAGRREAAGDSRNMWPEYLRLLRELKPRWAVAENPTGILSAPRVKGDAKGTFFGDILREMDEMGFAVGWGVWGACDVEHDEGGAPLPAESSGCAPHQRERVFIVVYRDGEREPQSSGLIREGGRRAGNGGIMADADHAGLQVAGRESGIQAVPARDGAQYTGVSCGYVGDAKRCRQHREPWRRPGQEPADGHQCDVWRPEPRLGGNPIRTARRLDFFGWPAGRGAEQFAWEPPRTIPGGSAKGRATRLKMLGNMVMPDQAAVLFREIMEADETMGGWEDGQQN